LYESAIPIVCKINSGIGAGIAQHIARDGAKVIINYHSNGKAAEETVAAIRAEGGTAEAIKGDVSIAADVDRLFSETKRLFGRVCHIYITYHPFHDSQQMVSMKK
jgi:NAD(P)-dependent dehydrogenase (short-subunit alcohol dehydrogenase family)